MGGRLFENPRMDKSYRVRFKKTVACIANTFANVKLNEDCVKRKGHCCLEKL